MDILLSLISGGATGIIGTVLSGILKFFTAKQQNEYEIQKTEMELKTMAAEAEHAEKIASINAEAAETQAEWEGLKASYTEAASRLSSGNHPALVWVDVVRGLMRPLLTTMLLVLVAIVYFQNQTSGVLKDQIVSTILYLATASVLWWFGSRQVEKALKK